MTNPNPDTERSGDGCASEQLRRLRNEGGSYRSIAAASGLAPSTVHGLATGRLQPTPHTTRALAKVSGKTLPRARVDAGGARLRLRALHVMGHGSARIARALGVREATIRRIVRGDAPTISTKLRDEITGLYEAWWDKRAPERTGAERAATLAARRRAATGNWCAGAGLDDDELDTPGYRPASGWKHATGTGIAPDIRPPVRTRKPNRTTRGQTWR
jgi:transcriptional regulator with XRE-family HTH domain